MPAETAFSAPHVLERRQTWPEEIANSVSHGLGFVAATVGAPFLIVAAARRGPTAEVVGASVFIGSALMLYLTSTIYHALPRNTAKRVFQALDHCAIFVLIAGSYTPFTLGVLRGAWGWSLFGVVWGLAGLGLALELFMGLRHMRFSHWLYVAMGWLALVAVYPLWTRMPWQGLMWVALGGACYTGGVAFYRLDRMPYAHFIWHLFVLAGTASHFFAVLWFSS